MRKITRLIILYAFFSTLIFFTWQVYIEEAKLPYRFTTLIEPPIFITKGPVASLNFYSRESLDLWHKKIFCGEVYYFIDKAKQEGALHALSRYSCSGLYYKIKFDAKVSPMMNWKWQVARFPDKSNMKNSDDYAARIYVIFPALFFPNSKALEYVWDKDLPEGAVLTSKFTRNIKIIVVRSGEGGPGEWVSQERNIYEDYKTAFGRPPELHVGAVAIMTDSDETKSIAEAFYADINVGYQTRK